MHNKARTPLERLEESGGIRPQRLKSLKRFRDATNSLRLREEIHSWIEQLLGQDLG